MVYVLNPKRGTLVNDPVLGQIPGGVAIEITFDQQNRMERRLGLLTFDHVWHLKKKAIPFQKRENPSEPKLIIPEGLRKEGKPYDRKRD